MREYRWDSIANVKVLKWFYWKKLFFLRKFEAYSKSLKLNAIFYWEKSIFSLYISSEDLILLKIPFRTIP